MVLGCLSRILTRQLVWLVSLALVGDGDWMKNVFLICLKHVCPLQLWRPTGSGESLETYRKPKNPEVFLQYLSGILFFLIFSLVMQVVVCCIISNSWWLVLYFGLLVSYWILCLEWIVLLKFLCVWHASYSLCLEWIVLLKFFVCAADYWSSSFWCADNCLSCFGHNGV